MNFSNIVSTIFQARDENSKAFARMSKNAALFGKKSESAFNKANKSASQFGSVFKGILAAGAVQQGIGLIKQGITSAVTGFIEFDHAATGAAVRFKDIGPNATDFADRLKRIKQVAREAGATTEYTASQAAEALDFLARAGWKSEEAFLGLNSMINLATSTGEDFARVADISSDLLGSFSMNSDVLATKIANLNRLNDALVSTVNSTNVTVETLFETMKQVGPVATKIFGEGLEEITAMAGVLGSNSIKGGEAMTTIKNAYLRLAAPAKDAADLMNQMNLKMADASGNPKKMVDVLDELNVKLKSVGKIRRAEILDTLFGKYAIAGVATIMSETKAIRELTIATKAAKDINAQTAAVMRGDMKNTLAGLVSALTETGFAFMDAFSGTATSAIQTLTTFVRSIDMTPVISAFKMMGKAVSFVFDAISFAMPFLKPFVTTLLILKAPILAITAATKIWAIAQGVLNVVMAANPFGIISIAIAAIAAGIYLLVNNWDLVTEKISSGVKFIWGWFQKLLDNPLIAAAATIFAPFITIPALIYKHWQPIKDFFSEIFGYIEKIMSSGISSVFKFFGISTEEKTTKQPTAPIIAERQSPMRPEVNTGSRNEWSGRLDIAGAPQGSNYTPKSSKGAPPVDVRMLGTPAYMGM